MAEVDPAGFRDRFNRFAFAEVSVSDSEDDVASGLQLAEVSVSDSEDDVSSGLQLAEVSVSLGDEDAAGFGDGFAQVSALPSGEIAKELNKFAQTEAMPTYE